MELEQVDLAEKFLAKALNMLQYATPHLSKQWREHMQVENVFTFKLHFCVRLFVTSMLFPWCKGGARSRYQNQLREKQECSPNWKSILDGDTKGGELTIAGIRRWCERWIQFSTPQLNMNIFLVVHMFRWKQGSVSVLGNAETSGEDNCGVKSISRGHTSVKHTSTHQSMKAGSSLHSNAEIAAEPLLVVRDLWSSWKSSPTTPYHHSF